jgi:hypothetical protein
MFENQMNPFQNIYSPDHGCSQNIHAHQYNTALNQFRFALMKGRLFRLRMGLLNRASLLYDLNTLKRGLGVQGSCYSGIRVVPVRAVIGSEGRTADFDLAFHPLGEAARERWVNMAIVYLSRIPLPPIQLIRVNEAYFVRDGHHRISVARTFGQAAMDAEVITWNAASAFPWQPVEIPENPFMLKGAHLST